MVNTHSNAIVTASAGTDEKAGSPPVSQTACFRIDVADENSFSLGKLGAIRHNYHLHPLMQMGRLAQLAKSLVATEQCRFIARDTTVSSAFRHKGKARRAQQRRNIPLDWSAGNVPHAVVGNPVDFSWHWHTHTGDTG